MQPIHDKKNANQYKNQIKQEFSKINEIYEISNHLMSFYTDNVARKIMIKLLKKYRPISVLDIGVGPGTTSKQVVNLINPTSLVGLDLSPQMVKKAKTIPNLQIVLGVAEKLPFREHSFDATISGFFTRHYTDYFQGYKERSLVLNSKGVSFDIELGKIPTHKLFFFHHLFFTRIIDKLSLPITLPLKLLTEYRLLPESYSQSPPSSIYLKIIPKTGFQKALVKALFMGFYMIIIGLKK